jgi:DGQHR domain-containing protein
MQTTTNIRVPAIRLDLPAGRQLFAFGIDGKAVKDFATVSRIRRDTEGAIGGYQRPEVLSHIAEIRNYLEAPGAMIPNAVVIAFDRPLEFEPYNLRGSHEARGYSELGVLAIPLSHDFGETDKPGFVVDGQQRLAAIREAEVASFPIFVVAFVAANVSEQKEQFILVNSTKPLPKGLIYELLPDTQGLLPSFLRKRKLPALLADRLNRDADSPLRGMIRTPTTPEGVIKDNSVLRLLENSLNDGVLYRCRTEVVEPDDRILPTVKNFWGAVRSVFADAWGLPPKKSRLLHGAGVVTLGFLMDAVADRHRDLRVVPTETFMEDLRPLKDVCRWTDGYWDFGPGQQRKWNEIQNTPRDVQVLSNHLLLQYRSRVWSRQGGSDSVGNQSPS